MNDTDAPRLVIRRKRRESPEPHRGAWKIAYADYVTAMMAFFLVMWLVALVPRESLGEMAQYFRMPLMDAIRGGESVNDQSSVIPGQSPSVIPNQNPLPSQPSTQDEDRRDTQRLENLKAQLEALINTDPVLRQFRPQLLLDMTPEGLRIQIVDQQNRPMFQTGSATVQPYMRTILRELGPLLNEIPNSLTISGHTDAQQYARGDRAYSNWELSADRANSARQELIAGGMSGSKVKRILGLASTVHLIKDEANAAVNRRISVVVLNQRTERRLDEGTATHMLSVDAQGRIEETVEAPLGASGLNLSDGYDESVPADAPENNEP